MGHYFPANPKAITGVVADALTIIRSFIADELNDEPRTLLGQATWSAMLQAQEVYNAEKLVCNESFVSVSEPSEEFLDAARSLACLSCGSDLLELHEATRSREDWRLRCRACDAEAWGAEVYESVQNGGAVPYVAYPECGTDAYVMEEHRCLYCGHEAEHECKMCVAGIPAEELDPSPYCGHYAYIMAKDD